MSVEIILGPMFSGKSSYAISYIRRHLAIGKRVVAIKPNIDVRYSDQHVIVTHDRETIPCIMWDISDPLGMIDAIRTSNCIVIEEAQFFLGLKSFVHELVFTHKKQVLVVGLDGDATQKKFGEILDCIPFAESVKKLNAFCHICKDGTHAPFSKKLSSDESQVDVGGQDKYVAVCLKHLSKH
jgi:thymidine kinase